MALSADVIEYTPPRRIQQMERELSPLSQLWDSGPWGWSKATKHNYRKMGIAEAELPTEDWLKEVRRLSSREFSCEYLKRLLKEIPDERLLGYEMQMHSSDISDCGKGRIFKSLWSSSGRGIFTVDGLSHEHLKERLQGLITAHGGFVSDRFYENKQTDCAMEFHIGEKGAEFLGYSVFRADRNGTYQYNIVDSQEQLRRLIGMPEELLSRLVGYHLQTLSQTAYRGYVGIDMLTTSDHRLHPVVEINFRMNMGILALWLYQRYGADATVALTPQREHGFSARIEDGRLLIDYRR